MRLTAGSGAIWTPGTGLSILYLRCEAAPVVNHDTEPSLSILYLRCILLRLEDELVEELRPLSILYLRCRAQRMVWHPAESILPLSILYLRCLLRNHSRHSRPTRSAFNSLFEMPRAPPPCGDMFWPNCFQFSI